MAGRTISHYRIVEKLGEGGMGVVYRAEDILLKRPAALKFISAKLSGDDICRRRFLQEARAASALDHPNICTIYEVGEADDGAVFIAMAYYPGQSLKQRIGSRGMPAEEAVGIAIEIAQGLACAHAAGVVHRDIKPANVVLTTGGAVKILDFGLARRHGDPTITEPGTAVGTTPYMSPEQVRGGDVDHRSDLWSLGVVLYQMLSGRLPFRAATKEALAYAILKRQFDPIAGLAPDLDGTLRRALEKARGDRFQSASAFIAALRENPTASMTAFPRSVHVAESRRRVPSVAVLPFSNLSSDIENEYFADGLTEELITALSRSPDLHVVSRTSAFEFKSKAQDIRKIAELLNVEHVLEGSVRRAGGRLRVTAQLVKAADGFQLWSERFDRELKDVFAIQDEIATAIVAKLRVRLSSERAAPLARNHTESMEAYHLYLRGRFHWNRGTEDGFSRAVDCFEHAIKADPEYAPAYAGLADYYSTIAAWTFAPPLSCWGKAKENALRSLALDSTLAEAHTALGTVRAMAEWDWNEAERCFLRGLEVNPGYADGHMQYADLLARLGRTEEAMAEADSALDRDPLSVRFSTAKGGVLHYARDYARSLEICRAGLDLNPDDIEMNILAGLNLEQQKRYGEAIAALEKAATLALRHPLVLAPLAANHSLAGNAAAVAGILIEIDRAAETLYVDPIVRVMVYLGMGDHDRVFDWLERAAESRSYLLTWAGVGPIYDPVRADPRFMALMERMGLGDVHSRVLSTQAAGGGRA